MALRDFLEQAWADVNPFDNGATGATIRAKKKPAPAPMPSPGGGRPSITQQQQSSPSLPTLKQPQIQRMATPAPLTANSAVHPPMAAAINPTAPKPVTPAFDPIKAAGDVIHGAGNIVNDFVVKPVVDSANTMGNAFATQASYIGHQLDGSDAAGRKDMLQHQADSMRAKFEASQIPTGAPLAPSAIAANTAQRDKLLRTSSGDANIAKTIMDQRNAEREDVIRNNDPVKVGAAGVNLVATAAAPGMAGLAENAAIRTAPIVGNTASKIIGGAVSQMPVGAVLGATGQLQQTGSKTKLGDFAASTAMGAVGGGIVGAAAPVVGAALRKGGKAWLDGSEAMVNHGDDVTIPAGRANEGGFAKAPGDAPVPAETPRPMTEWADEFNGKDPRIADQPMQPAAPMQRTAAVPEDTLPLAARTSPTDTLPLSSEPTIPNKTTDVKLNTRRLDISDDAKLQLDKDTAETINRMSNKEVQEAAKAAGIDYKSYGETGTRNKIAEQLNLRRQAAEVTTAAENAQKAGNIDDAAQLLEHAAELGRTSRAQGTDVARQLQARRIIADQMNTPQQKIFRLLDEAGIDPKVYSKKLAGVDFNDANQVVAAYRELVPAKFGDWLDKYRYTNMLSAPLTHIVNITSNMQGVGLVRPLRQVVEGGLDAIHSAATGQARTRFAGEAGQYYKAAFNSVPEAVTNFKNVMSGKKSSEMLDTQQITNGRLATKGIAGKLDSVLSFVPKLLEASDQMGVTIAKSGEKAALEFRKGKGAKVAPDLDGLAQDNANYTLFRQELGKEGQGAVLEAIDAIPKTIMQWRNHKNPIISTTAKFTIPFVTTPANLFKQGIEFSPAGILTIPGAADKTAQAAKVAIGTAAMGLTAGAFAANDAITFSEPSDPKQRDAFRAEGKQPYAIKIGDNWVGYSKLHPAIAFNLAMVGAVKDALDKGAVDQSQADKILQIGSSALGFFRDQSYMKSVGDFTNTVQLKDGATIADAFGTLGTNWGNQVAPFKSMVSWIGRMVDPTQRKIDYDKSTPEQIYQGLVKDIPGLNNIVPARENPYTGEAIKNDHPILNSFVPTRVTDDRGFGNTTGLNMDQRMIQSALPTGERPDFRQSVVDQKFADKTATAEKDQIKKATDTLTKQSSGGVTTASANTTPDSSTADIKKLSNGKFYTKVGDEYKTFDTQAKAQDAIDSANQSKALDTFKTSGKKTLEIDGKMYYKKGDGTVGSKDKFEYTADQKAADYKLTMARSKTSGDVTTWQDTAKKQYDLIAERMNRMDPETQSAEIDALQMQADSLLNDYEKYSSYGGFTKPKKGSSKGKSSNGLSYKIDGYGTGATGTAKSLREILRSAHLSKARA